MKITGKYFGVKVNIVWVDLLSFVPVASILLGASLLLFFDWSKLLMISWILITVAMFIVAYTIDKRDRRIKEMEQEKKREQLTRAVEAAKAFAYRHDIHED